MTEAEYGRYTLLAEVAELYFLRGMQQVAIADRMNISRSLVSRMISEAQEKGIVSITINHYFKRSPEIEQKLCQAYGLDECGVFILPAELPVLEIKKLLGKFAANIIYDNLNDGDIVGLTFGTSLKEAIEALSLKSPKQITPLQLTGSLGASAAAFDSHELVQKLSSAWTTEGVFLHAPYMVNSEEIKRQLYSSPSNSLNAELCGKLDAAVVGLSSLDSRGTSALYRGGHLRDVDLQLMRRHDIIGDVGSFSLSAEGALVEVEPLIRMVGLNEKDWKKIKMRFGLAFGEEKVDIIKAALQGGWLTTLITDLKTAGRLL